MKRYNVVPLGEILNTEYNQTKIEDAFKKFSCQRETDLENFLTYKAIPYQKTGFRKIGTRRDGYHGIFYNCAEIGKYYVIVQ